MPCQASQTLLRASRTPPPTPLLLRQQYFSTRFSFLIFLNPHPNIFTIPKMTSTNIQLPDVVLHHLTTLLSTRQHPKTLCPSEVARSLTPTELRSADVSTWRDLMPDIRSYCFQLRDEGSIEILQRGEMVTEPIDEVRGPIRIRKKA